MEKGQRHEAVLRTDDPLPAPEISEEAQEYRDILRAHWLRSRGRSKEEVAQELVRAAGWVSRWWQTPPEQVPRPYAVPPYIAEYELRMLQSGVQPFRPPVLRRGYVPDTAGLYEECAQMMPWRQAVFRKRNYQTGEVTVTSIASSRQDSSYPGLHTGIPRLDAALERLRKDFDVRDPRAYLLNNWYPDGNTSIAPHNHDFWSAIISFGAPRVFLLDGQPILLGSGDLLVFGTQRHSVPKMPEVKDGRVSVAVFWYLEEEAGAEDGLLGEGACSQCGDFGVQLRQAADGRVYCEPCWSRWQAGEEPPQESSDDEAMALALELSMLEK